MQEDKLSFRKKLIVQLLKSNLNEIDITKPLYKEDDHDDENNDLECNITSHIYKE
jgi:hypothetical protein